MAFSKYKDLCVKTGEYTTAGGEIKGRWLNVGSIMRDSNGGEFLFLSKWFNPAGIPDLQGKNSESIVLSMFDPKPRDGQPAAAPTMNTPGADVPF